MVKKIIFDDGIGNRDRKHRNFIFSADGTFFDELKFESLPGICRVLETTFIKNGKWSKNVATVEIQDGFQEFVLHQDWDVGYYIPEKTWESAIENLVFMIKCCSKLIVPKEVAERFIRLYFPKAAEKLDREQQVWTSCNVEEYMKLKNEEVALKLQIAAEIQSQEEQEELVRMKEKNENLKQLLQSAKGKKLSLADLKEKLAQS